MLHVCNGSKHSSIYRIVKIPKELFFMEKKKVTINILYLWSPVFMLRVLDKYNILYLCK